MKQKPDKDADPLDGKSGKHDKKPADDAKEKSPIAKHKDIEEAFDGKPEWEKIKVHDGHGKGPGALAAKAFAMGEEIAFRNDKQSPHSAAHEAAHVVQQRNGAVRGKDNGALDMAKQPTRQKPGKPSPVDGKTAGKPKGAGSSSGLPHKAAIEDAFGADFSDVRTHTDGAKPSLDSKAMAIGDKIAFRGQAPDKKLVAHELAHTVQQQPGKVKPANGAPVFLKHPDAPAAKPKPVDGIDKKAEKKPGKTKPKVPADTQGKLEVPLDSDTLGALGDRMFQKLEKHAGSERDVTGAD